MYLRHFNEEGIWECNVNDTTAALKVGLLISELHEHRRFGDIDQRVGVHRTFTTCRLNLQQRAGVLRLAATNTHLNRFLASRIYILMPFLF